MSGGRAVGVVDAHVHLEAGRRLETSAGAAAPDDRFRRVVTRAACDAARGGASAVDVRLNPVSWGRRGVDDAAQRSILGEVRAWARAALGLDWRTFVTLKREATPIEWERALAFASSARPLVVGIDVSRDYDVDHPTRRAEGDPTALARTCRAAGSAGLVVAVHCGRFDTVAGMWEAIDVLGARRIGHALPAIEDADLEGRVAADGIVVEVCPSAFTRLSGRAWTAHPLPAWVDAGVSIAIGTDHPLAFRTDIRTEYALADAHAPGWRRALA